ncbi:MAG: hypothetical protein DLM61_12740 [Pseudonocardiales bacterium]|nr:MAG: hypothetical protein DLM61_12740 [Pseudonocardiales bacterium]
MTEPTLTRRHNRRYRVTPSSSVGTPSTAARALEDHLTALGARSTSTTHATPTDAAETRRA